MKTDIDAVDEVFKVIWNSPLRSEISGSVKRYKRPTRGKTDPEKEDIVINTLGMNGNQLQEGVVNVNIHVPNPDYQMVLDGKTVILKDQPDEERLKQLSDLAIPILKEHIGRHVYFWFQQSIPFFGDVSSYINIRLDVKAKNLKQ